MRTADKHVVLIRHRRLFARILCCAFAQIVAVGPAFSDPNNAANLLAATSDTAKSNQAPETKAEQPELQEVLVTAEKRRQPAQDVPVSMTVVSGSALLNAGIDKTTGLTITTPGLVMFSPYATTGQISLRGVSSFALQGIGSDPSTATYVDGVYMPRFESSLFDLLDVSQVTVLKGPQVVLYGRNSMGGSITYTSNTPTNVLGGQVTQTFGDYGLISSTAVLNVPMVNDELLLRVAAIHVAHGGYQTNILNPSDRPGSEDSSLGRVTLEYLPADWLTFTARAYLGEEASGNSPMSTKALNPLAMGSAYNLTDPWKVSSNQSASEPMRNSGESMTIKAATGWGEFTSITAYNKQHFGPLNYDADTTELQIFSAGVPGQPGLGLFQDSNTFSEEDYLTGHTTYLHWILGGDYSHEVADYGGSDEAGTTILYFPSMALDKAYSGYGQLDYEVLRGLHLIAGVRYSDETKKAGRTLNPTPPFQYNEDTWSSWTPSYTLSYHISHDKMLYATASHGFKSGGFNQFDVGPALQPEHIVNYEVGTKTSWFERKLQVDMDLYKYIWSNMQVSAPTSPSNPLALVYQNAASASGRGAELSIAATLTRRLQLHAGLSMERARFDQYKSFTQSYTGDTLPFAPHFTLGVGASYIAPVAHWGSATVRLDDYWSTRSYFDQTENLNLSQGSYDLLNARLAIAPMGNGWQVSVWGRNITNRLIYSSAYALAGTYVVTLDPPRTYGIDIHAKF